MQPESSPFLLSGIADEAGDSITEQIAVHKRLGFNYIEVRNVDRITVDTMSDERFKAVMAQLNSNNIRISCLASDVGKLHLSGEKYMPFEKDVASLESLLKRAVRAGCSFIRVMGYRPGGEVSNDEWLAQSVERLKVLADMAKKSGVYLALENCVGWYANSGKDMAYFLERVASDHLVCLYDTGNPVCQHGADSWEFYQNVKERIGYVHIKDATGHGEHYTYPGEGDGKVPEILADLYKRGYSGFVSIEPHMTASAHRPDTKYIMGTPEETYYKYGTTLINLIKEKIL